MAQWKSEGRSGKPLAHPEIDLAHTDRTDLGYLVAGLPMITPVNTQTMYHPVGSCAMGSGDSAAVDPEHRGQPG